jgi:hypothetical protein
MCEAGGAWAGMQRAYAAAERDLKAIIARGRL